MSEEIRILQERVKDLGAQIALLREQNESQKERLFLAQGLISVLNTASSDWLKGEKCRLEEIDKFRATILSQQSQIAKLQGEPKTDLNQTSEPPDKN